MLIHFPGWFSALFSSYFVGTARRFLKKDRDINDQSLQARG